MSDPTTWSTLSKTVTDLTTIIQQIQADLLTHNQDPSAHGQSGEGVYTHRIASLLDHVSESVTNTKILKMARSFKAIVDPAGNGDFATIQPAINAVNADGGGRIFLKNSIYQPGADLTLYSNIELVGEDNDAAIVDFEDAGYGLVAVGALGNRLRNIHAFNIQVINSHKQDYGAFRFDYVDDYSIRFCKFEDNFNSGAGNGGDIYANLCWDGLLEKNYSLDSGPHFTQLAGGNNFVLGNRLLGCLDMGLILSGDVWALSNYMNAVASTGIYVDGDDAFLGYNEIIDAEGNGIDIVNTSARAQIYLNTLFGGAALKKGIRLSSSGKRNKVLGNTVEGGFGWGIHADDGDYHVINSNNVRTVDNIGLLIDNTCDRCTVVGNDLFDNVTPFTDNGTNTNKGHNVVA